VFVGELIHTRIHDDELRNIQYLHDVLVFNGKKLYGETYADRLEFLEFLFKDHLDANTWIAQSHRYGFEDLFDSLRGELNEGLVLKNPNAKLKPCTGPTANSAWQVKCRKATKQFAY
jgi:ATP-dependent DNA ligase